MGIQENLGNGLAANNQVTVFVSSDQDGETAKIGDKGSEDSQKDVDYYSNTTYFPKDIEKLHKFGQVVLHGPMYSWNVGE